jgi:hypothetical protein
MPSINNWALKQIETMKDKTLSMTIKTSKTQENILLRQNVGTAVDKSDGDEQLEEVAKDILKKSFLQSNALKWLWTQTVVDITSTLHEVAQMVLNDRNVSPEVRKKRGEGLLVLGEIFQNVKGTGVEIPEQEGLEEVAFHAMLDTVWRQEKAARTQYETVAEAEAEAET